MDAVHKNLSAFQKTVRANDNTLAVFRTLIYRACTNRNLRLTLTNFHTGTFKVGALLLTNNLPPIYPFTLG